MTDSLATNEIKDFNDFLQASGMTELRAIGRRYTWSNGQICSTIDRALVNAEWLLTVTVTEVIVLNPEISYHTPLSIQLKDDVKGSSKPFRFLNCLAEHKDFLNVVANTWCRTTEKNHIADISLKSRQAQNRIKSLIDSNGDILQQPENIVEEVTSFYKKLLDSAADQLPAINPEIMKRGNVLNRQQQQQLQLITHVTHDEVYQALMSIDFL
ncbi:uncharacterized protein LOC107800158 [Nicotiana tabacum]|uniref:Uncharacterized protein LOC107800158 n=1 Tax=Nicotiana tabacum TaxID=4097 RepID=A0A1S4AQ39_TOBAC